MDSPETDNTLGMDRSPELISDGESAGSPDSDVQVINDGVTVTSGSRAASTDVQADEDIILINEPAETPDVQVVGSVDVYEEVIGQEVSTEEAPVPLSSVRQYSPYDVASSPDGSVDDQSSLADYSSLDDSSNEFKSPPKKKPKTSKSESETKETCDKGPESDEDDCDTCPICFEQYNNSGSHRLASLKCGHLFGQSCIEKWLKGGAGGKCPQCNANAKRTDIRNIFAKSLKTLDTSERDRALKELEDEKLKRRKAEYEAAQAKLRCQMALEECAKLKLDFEKQKQQLRACRGDPGQSSTTDLVTNAQSKFVEVASIQLWEAGGCRVLAHCAPLGSLVASVPSGCQLFPGYGVKMVSTLDLRSNQYVALHSKPIRDIAPLQNSPVGLTLSCGMDKQLKVTSLESKSTVQRYTTEALLWSCCWNEDDTNYVYGGQSNGVVSVFDLRNTNEAVKVLNVPGRYSPVVSLQYVPRDVESSFRPGGLLVGQLNNSTFFETKPEVEFRTHALPLKGALTCLTFESRTRHLMASFRPSASVGHIRHQLLQLFSRSLETEPDELCSCQEVNSFPGGSVAKTLTRTSLFTHPGDEKKLMAAVGDEASKKLQLFDPTTGALLEKHTVPSPVMDICSYSVDNKDFLAALTDTTVKIYEWR